MMKKIFDNDNYYGTQNTVSTVGCIILAICYIIFMANIFLPKKEVPASRKSSDDEAFNIVNFPMEEPPVENFEDMYHQNFSNNYLSEVEVASPEVPSTEIEEVTPKETVSEESTSEKNVSKEKSSSESKKATSEKKTEESSDENSKKKSLDYYQKRAKSLNLPEDYDVEKAIQGMEYLVNEQNFSVEGASGIIGNLFSESRFNGAEVYGSHIGIAQWDANRWPLIEDWLYVNEYKEHSFLGQLMAIFESKDGDHFQETFHAMRNMSDAEVAALYWLEKYEKAPGQAEAERQWIAQLTYELYTE